MTNFKNIALALFITILVIGCSGSSGTTTDSSDNSETTTGPTDPSATGSADPETGSTTGGSISGYYFLEGESDNSGITVAIGDLSTTTASDGSYMLTNVPEGAHVVTFSYGRNCRDTGTVSGQAVYSDGRTDASNTMVVFQYHSDCWYKYTMYNIAVFDGQNTEMENHTLTHPDDDQQYTTTDANGNFAFEDVPMGTYQGQVPIEEDYSEDIYAQEKGTYAIALAQIGCDEECGDEDWHDGSFLYGETSLTTSYLCECYGCDRPVYRNDPFYQNSHPITIVTDQNSNMGNLTLYPVFPYVVAPQLIAEQADDYHWYNGFDFSGDIDVDVASGNADVYMDLAGDILSVKSNLTNIKSLGATNLQDVTAATGSYVSAVELGSYTNLGWGENHYSDVLNTVFEAQSIEGKYVKFRILNDGGLTSWSEPATIYGTTRSITTPIQYYYEASGASTFSH